MVISAKHFTDVTNGYEKRTDGLWVHGGKLKVGTLEVTGSARLPAGTAQARIGSYAAAATWATSNINTWQESNVQVNATSIGAGSNHVEWTFTLTHNTVGAWVYYQLLVDGVVGMSHGLWSVPVAGAQLPVGGSTWAGTYTGTRRYGIGLYTNAGIASIANSSVSQLFVTEMRA